MILGTLRRVVAGLWCLMLTAQIQAQPPSQPPAPLSVADAVRPVNAVQAAISPDGRHVLALMNRNSGSSVMLVDTTDFSHRFIVAGQWELDGAYNFARYPRSLAWITSELFAVNYGAVASSHDLSGKRIADLGVRVLGKSVPADPQSTWVVSYDDFKLQQLALYDARTGKSRRLRYPMSGQLIDWELDGQGQLRVLTLANSEFWNDRTVLSHWYRGPREDAPWTQLDSFKVTDETWWPVAVTAGQDELIVKSREGRNTWAVFRYDPVQQTRGELLLGDANVDIDHVVFDAGASRYRSFVKAGMKPDIQWLDAGWAALQRAVDAVVPGRTNVLSGSDPKGKVLVHSFGDVDPGVWYVLDVPTMKMRLLLEAKPDIDPAQMRPKEVLSYAAADGLPIPAYLTRPGGGSAPWPLVVMVHGGPAVRDGWNWEPDVQLLASRGYVVLQPQFRGSAGFGKAFEDAGVGQWGRAMQDDITAGVQHLIRAGIADPQRICIYGASYGGYAAVWGLIKTPELYRCGVSFAGVSDIGRLFSDSGDSTALSREWLRLRTGDPERDKARLDEVSPVLRARDIRAPLFIAHGDDDVRVLIGHSERLMKAMDKAGRPYEWLLLKGEGHGLSEAFNHELLMNRILAFIDHHIGRPADAPAAR
jgi:dipeptidyl aminopeptidase/acylaminoacyl peptidase